MPDLNADTVIAPETTSSPDVIGSMSDSERQTWRMTGTLPNLSDAPDSSDAQTSTDAASSPAQPVAQAASTDASAPPASESGTPKKANAETRKAELAAEIQALLKQRDQLRADVASPAPRPSASPDVPAASSPAPQSRTLQSVIASPDLSRPPLSDTEFFTEFQDATVADYTRYVTRDELMRARRDDEAQRQVETSVSRFRSKMDAVVKVDPKLMDRLPASLDVHPLELMPAGQQPGPLNYALQEILDADAPVAAKLLAHLIDHPEIVNTIQRGSARMAIRTIAQIEARLESSPVPPAAPAATPVSLAPPPPTTLGTKPAQPADEIADAIKSGDVARYRELMNRKDMARA